MDATFALPSGTRRPLGRHCQHPDKMADRNVAVPEAAALISRGLTELHAAGRSTNQLSPDAVAPTPPTAPPRANARNAGPDSMVFRRRA